MGIYTDIVFVSLHVFYKFNIDNYNKNLLLIYVDTI